MWLRSRQQSIQVVALLASTPVPPLQTLQSRFCKVHTITTLLHYLEDVLVRLEGEDAALNGEGHVGQCVHLVAVHHGRAAVQAGKGGVAQLANGIGDLNQGQQQQRQRQQQWMRGATQVDSISCN